MTADDCVALANGDYDARIVAIGKVVLAEDNSAKPFLQAMLDDSVKFAGDKVFVIDASGNATDPITGATVALPADAEDVINNNLMRSELEAGIAFLNLNDPDRAVRAAAIDTLRDSDIDDSKSPLLEHAIAQEKDAELRDLLSRVLAGVQLLSTDKTKRLHAAQLLGESTNQNFKQMLSTRLADGGESDPEVRAAIQKSIDSIDRKLRVYDIIGQIFTGISLGSILLLAALGLAITYGLMGVINMAHGEMMMLGAYSTFVVQNFFRTHFPGAFDAYIIAAIPVAFVVTGVVGMILERTVIRFLYGRPLETLLATWGISLMLMQSVRSIFGAQNVLVENPAWLSGGVAVSANLTLPYNRIAIIVFSAAVLLLMWLLLSKTRLGLFVRAVTQNRGMARCVGVNTASVDMRAFGLGSGIAGLAGVALSQVTNVGPDLGSNYIVDSFMVVVLGGVGQLAGAVYAALGLGIISKFLEGVSGAVLAKIIVLVIIIVFIQKRPQGLFALKGRSADA
ncbi:MAG TPA: urea ABC transporter permease subunit UrtB [Spongiibacteraceae bacterium]|nr:urea ABC transporter permease subunit UrtB [Spongiibacteraceae bacterium]